MDTPTEKLFTRRIVFAMAIGAVMLLAAVDILVTANKMALEDVPLVNAATKIKLEVYAARFRLEEAMHHDGPSGLETVFRHLDRAELCCQAMLGEGEVSHKALDTLADDKLQHALHGVSLKLGSFRRATEQRWEEGRSGTPDPQVDERYALLFEELVQQATAVESQIEQAIAAKKDTLWGLQMCLAIAAAVLVAFLAGIIHRELRQRKTTEKQLRRAKTVAEAANRSKSEFLANMSHEIRTPLTAILGFADILRGEGNLSEAPPQRIEAIETIGRNGQYLLRLINDILDLSKIESGVLELEQVDCSPWQVVSDAVVLMNVRAASKGLPLVLAQAGPIPERIRTDPTRLRQILINLIGNAIKFTELGEVRLTVRTHRQHDSDGKLEFSVSDTGIGIPEDRIDKLFAPFVQADTSTTREFGGTGLGLAICKRLAEMLGGEIAIESVLGEGSRVSFSVATGPLDGVTLRDDLSAPALSIRPGDLGPAGSLDAPRSVGAPPAQPASTRPNDPSVAQKRLPFGCRVLLAEDGPDNQRLISLILKKAGAEVTVADNGQVAMDSVLAAQKERRPYHAVLMDMQMPVLDGYDATKRLRAQGSTVPIIALTAHAMPTDRAKCLGAGCSGYATKPINRTTLLEVVWEHVRDVRQPSDDPRLGETPVLMPTDS